MILICSAGHRFDLAVEFCANLEPGLRCPRLTEHGFCGAWLRADPDQRPVDPTQEAPYRPAHPDRPPATPSQASLFSEQGVVE